MARRKFHRLFVATVALCSPRSRSLAHQRSPFGAALLLLVLPNHSGASAGSRSIEGPLAWDAFESISAAILEHET